MRKGGTRYRKFVGIPIARSSLEGAASIVARMRWAGDSGADIHLINAFSISLAERDKTYRECLESAAHNFPDGKPLSILTQFSTEPLKQVRGPSLFELVLDRGRYQDVRHYFLGSTQATLETLVEAVRGRYPGIVIAGTYSPPFRELTEQDFAAQDALILHSQPDIVWVGLGTPKQDFEAQRLARKGFNAVAVGAAFDFSAGTKKEAPSWASFLGVEWLFRLVMEPRRLWRRYLIGNIRFLIAVIRRPNS